MTIQRRLFRMPVFVLLLALTLCVSACGDKKPAADAQKNDKASAENAAKEKEALDTAVEAYVYASPLVTMEYTRRRSERRRLHDGLFQPATT